MRRRAVALLAAVAATALLWLLLLGDEGEEGPGAEVPRSVNASEQARGLLARLSVEEKVDQLLLVGAAGGAPAIPAPGGFLIDAGSWAGSEQGAELIAALREGASAASVPPLIATVQEGGEYRALYDLPPRAREIAVGDLGDRAAAEAWARQAAEALRRVGVDLNLAPVADIASLDSPIADRAFSDDPATTRRMTVAAIRGCARGGIACAPSHFPGLGGASQDTDLGPATVSLDAATLLARDLEPFRAAFEAGAPAVVVSHAFYAAYDPVTPASLSPAILVGLLRREAGFEGAAISDELGAGAIQASYGGGEAAVAAIAAGIDMLQLADPAAAEGVRQALLRGAREGAIAPERLDDAAGHVIDLKRALGLI